MILSDSAIRAARERGEIVIEPWDPRDLSGNSYDVHLSRYYATYSASGRAAAILGGASAVQPEYYYTARGREQVLDVRYEHLVDHRDIGDDGLLLEPGELYLMSTAEYTETHRHVPYLDGRSSVGRLGVSVHVTAGRGDVGFRGHWTLEVTTVKPARVFAGMRLGQITFHEVAGEVEQPYGSKARRSYPQDRDPRPAPSKIWLDYAGGR